MCPFLLCNVPDTNRTIWRELARQTRTHKHTHTYTDTCMHRHRHTYPSTHKQLLYGQTPKWLVSSFFFCAQSPLYFKIKKSKTERRDNTVHSLFLEEEDWESCLLRMYFLIFTVRERSLYWQSGPPTLVLLWSREIFGFVAAGITTSWDLIRRKDDVERQFVGIIAQFVWLLFLSTVTALCNTVQM